MATIKYKKGSLKWLQCFAAKLNCSVEKNGRKYEWWRNWDHSIISECKTIFECYSEIYNEVFYNGNS